jgi:photosystem II stability/assembly factor-like uncharacterized protein
MKKFILPSVICITLIIAIQSVSGWEKVHGNLDDTYFNIEHFGDSVLMAYGFINTSAYPVIIKSTDLGLTWKYVVEETNDDYGFQYYKSYCPVSENKILLTTFSGKVRVSEDCFETSTWVQIDSVAMALQYISMFDEDYGIISTNIDTNLLYITKDGGYNWTEIPSPPCNVVMDVCIAEDKAITCTTMFLQENETEHAFFKTYDEGENWIKSSIPQYAFKIFFLDSLNGRLAGYAPTGNGQSKTCRLAKTSDGGLSWEMELDTITENHNFGFQDVHFCDEYCGTAVGQFGTIFRTTDGGNNWIEEFYNDFVPGTTGPATMAVRQVSPSLAVICDYMGSIYRYESTSGICTQGTITNSVVFPNPVEIGRNLNIQCGALGTNCKVVVFNLAGDEVYRRNGINMTGFSNSFSIPIGNEFLPGVYFLAVESEGETVVRKKIIIR